MFNYCVYYCIIVITFLLALSRKLVMLSFEYVFVMCTSNSGFVMLSIQNSLKAALRAKFKIKRPKLTSDMTVQAMQAKYGKPGVSGRKRKQQVHRSNDDIFPPLISACFKVNV